MYNYKFSFPPRSFKSSKLSRSVSRLVREWTDSHRWDAPHSQAWILIWRDGLIVSCHRITLCGIWIRSASAAVCAPFKNKVTLFTEQSYVIGTPLVGNLYSTKRYTAAYDTSSFCCTLHSISVPWRSSVPLTLARFARKNGAVLLICAIFTCSPKI
jgi:hypothetical protein